MDTVTVTFPLHIPPRQVIFLIEQGMKEHSEFKDVMVLFEGRSGNENDFKIKANCPNHKVASAFYYIGINSAIIIERYKSKQR